MAKTLMFCSKCFEPFTPKKYNSNKTETFQKYQRSELLCEKCRAQMVQELAKEKPQ